VSRDLHQDDVDDDLEGKINLGHNYGWSSASPNTNDATGSGDKDRRLSATLSIALSEDDDEESKTAKNIMIVDSAHSSVLVVVASSRQTVEAQGDPAHGAQPQIKYPNILTADTREEVVSLFFWAQFKLSLCKEFHLYRPGCVNFLRVFEVTCLAFLTGALFFNVGQDMSASGFGQKLSLLFFSTTLWTFTRMYPSVPSSFQWFLATSKAFDEQQLSPANLQRRTILPLVLARITVVTLLEGVWPLVYVLVCFPLAGVFGDVQRTLLMGLFLVLNNICYVSLGSLLGALSKSVPLGMIASTIVSQTTLVAAGFFTKLPPALDWIRYVSPFYWAFRGILKSSVNWSDTFECVKGSSDVAPSTSGGANGCFMEFHMAIDQYKHRGINVATLTDANSSHIYVEVLGMVGLFLALQLMLLPRCAFVWCNLGFKMQSVKCCRRQAKI
jgi:hypothetical protein